MFKKSAALILTAAAFMGTFAAAPTSAEACGNGYYQHQVQPIKCWVPARTERCQVREWVPAQNYYVNQTVVVSPGHWTYVNGCRRWCPPVNRTVRVQKCRPGYHRTVWRTRTIPGYYRVENRTVRVWVSTCHCRTNVRNHRNHRNHRRVQPRRPSARSFERETKRSGRKVNKEFKRTGRRIGRELKRIFG